MSYNDRVTIVESVIEEGFLGDKVVSEKEIVLPCFKGRLTNNQQIGIFGAYNLSAFKIHIQGIKKGIETIVYHGVRRKVKGTIFHKNSTVLIIE